MESRFRKLVSQRRDKSSANDLDTPAMRYQSASPKVSQPIFIYQALARNARETQKVEDSDSLLKGISYDSAVPGKAPIFVKQAQKGNGPIKLQTSRWLSSGELLTTSQDNRRTLADIREGDYILGQKPGRAHQTKLPKLSKLPASRPEVSTPSSRYTITAGASSSIVPNTAQTASLLSPQSDSLTRPETEQSVITAQKAGTNTGLGISTCLHQEVTNGHYETRNLSHVSLDQAVPIEALGGQNATISALWRAEYGQLVRLYGRDGADRRMARMDQQQNLQRISQASTQHSSKPPSMVLEPLPQPSYERKSFESERSNATSGRSSSYRDDASDASSFYRGSKASSYFASSSHTTSTSFGDFDSPASRDDIRKIVREMRSTYLRALETQPPTAAATKLRSSKKKRRPRAPRSPMSPQASTHKERIPSELGRQTWHGDDVEIDAELIESKKPRAASTPVEGFEELSTLEETSLAKSAPARPELQRADSTTLGNLMGDFASKSTEVPPPETGNLTARNDIGQVSRVQSWQASNVMKISHSDYAADLKMLGDQHLSVVAVDAVEDDDFLPIQNPSFDTTSTIHEHAVPRPDMRPIRPPPLSISQMPLVNFI